MMSPMNLRLNARLFHGDQRILANKIMWLVERDEFIHAEFEWGWFWNQYQRRRKSGHFQSVQCNLAHPAQYYKACQLRQHAPTKSSPRLKITKI